MKTLLDSVTVTVEEINGEFVASAKFGGYLFVKKYTEKEFKPVNGNKRFNSYVDTWSSIVTDPHGNMWATCNEKTISAKSTRDYAAVAALFDDLKKLAIENLKSYGGTLDNRESVLDAQAYAKAGMKILQENPGYGEFVTTARLETVSEKADN